MFNRLLLLLAVLIGISIPHMAKADPADIRASGRSVVRVVLVAKDEGKLNFVGHGSGVAIAPDKILTNAHVIDLARRDRSIVIGIIPSDGSKSYGGFVIATSQGNDLALIQVTDGGKIPPATFFTGPVNDAENVAALGYPGAVDRAQGLQLSDMIQPMAPVKTRGTVSGGRTSRQFDTILHTAPIASGNSGGPLVDNCGRVVGINSFGSLSDGNDAEFGFAVTNKEVLAFLRKTNQNIQTNSSACQSVAELSRKERERDADARAKVAIAKNLEQIKQDKAEEKARLTARNAIINERENAIALAALFLVFAVLAFESGGILFIKNNRNPAILTSAAGAVFIVIAVVIFFTRPSLGDVEDRIKIANKPALTATDTKIETSEGQYLCRFNPDRSRLTVSQVKDIPFDWKNSGCVNGRTQYGRNGAKWARIFVPNDEATVSVNSFSAQQGTFTVERYLLGIAQMNKARDIRGRYTVAQCSADQDVISELEDMQKAVIETLPAQPNERLVYDCEKVD